MSLVKISDLPAGSSVATTDLFESSQGASAPYTSRRVTGTQVRSFVLGGPVAIPADVVNHVSVSGGALGTTPTIATTSSAADVGLRLQSKGQGRTSLTSELGTLFSAAPNGGITPVNNILAIATATNSAPALVAEGSDANIGLSFNAKGSGFMLLSMGAGGVLQLAPGGSEKMRVDADGRVGIGTSAPGTRLDVSGTVSMTSYREAVFAITDGTTVNLDPNNGSIQTWTLGANRTPGQANWNAGQSITLMVDDGSAFTITWSTLAVVWVTGGGTAPTLNTSGFTTIALWKVGTTIYGARVGDA